MSKSFWSGIAMSLDITGNYGRNLIEDDRQERDKYLRWLLNKTKEMDADLRREADLSQSWLAVGEHLRNAMEKF